MKFSKFSNEMAYYNFGLKEALKELDSNIADADFDEIKKVIDWQVECLNSAKEKKANFKVFIKNYKNMNRKEFLKNYLKFYYLKDDEFIKGYINNYIGKDTKTAIIKTNDLVLIDGFEDNGSYYSLGYSGLNYKVVCDKSFNIEDRVYTKREIKALCNANKMLVLNTGRKRNYVRFPYLEDAKNDLDAKSLVMFNKMYAKIIDLIKSEFTNEELEKDYEKYCNDYKKQKYRVIDNIFKSKEMAKRMTKNPEKIIKESDEMIEELKTE